MVHGVNEIQFLIQCPLFAKRSCGVIEITDIPPKSPVLVYILHKHSVPSTLTHRSVPTPYQNANTPGAE